MISVVFWSKVMAEVGKKARGEAVVAAWSRVVLVIVGGSKVMHRLILQIVVLKIFLNSGDGGSEYNKGGKFSL